MKCVKENLQKWEKISFGTGVSLKKLKPDLEKAYLSSCFHYNKTVLQGSQPCFQEKMNKILQKFLQDFTVNDSAPRDRGKSSKIS